MKKSIIQFRITKGEDGFWVAECLDFSIITQAKTIEDLEKNIAESLQLYLEDESLLEEYGYSRKPTVLANFEVNAFEYA